jgi:hypothetical protein
MNKSDEKRDKIKQINDKLRELTLLKPESIIDKTDE